MRTPHFRGLSRLWDYLFDDWSTRLAKLGLSPRRTVARKSYLGWKPSRFTLETLEDRTVPDGRPLPLPFIFAGTAVGAPPLVRAYHAETGELAFERQPFDTGFMGGVRVSAGDINNDGTPDLIAAAGPGAGPHVRIYDGVTGDQLAGPLGSFYAYGSGFTGGVYVASGDVDGDEWADLITAAGAGAGPHIKVFSGRTGALLDSFYAYAPDFSGGATVAAADFTGDGRAEVVVGAGAGAGPHVKIFDLTTRDVIAGPLGSFYAFDSSVTGGVEVGTDFLTGDVTGDARPDLVVGAGPGTASRVKVYDGVSGDEVADFSPFGSGMTAGVRVAMAFIDDDEFADIIVGTGEGPTAAIKVFGGVDFVELDAPMSGYVPFGIGFTGGLFVAGSNDPAIASGALSVTPSSAAAVGASVTMLGTVSDVSSADGVQTPTGTIIFSVFSYSTSTVVSSWTMTLTASGTAGIAVAALTINPTNYAAGTYDFRMDTYSGDGWFKPNNFALLNPFTFSASSLAAPSLFACPAGNCPPTGVTPPAGVTNINGHRAMSGGVNADGSTSVTLFGGLGGAALGSVMVGSGGAVSWTNASGYADGLAKSGDGTVLSGIARLTQQLGGTKIAMIDNTGSSQWFDFVSGGTYTTPFGGAATLVQNSGTGELELRDGSGSTMYFYDFGVGSPTGRAGRLKRRVDAAGNVLQITSWDSAGRPTEVQMTDAVGGTVESLLSTYTSGGELDTLTRRRQIGGGSWTTIRAASFTYATVSGVTDKVLIATSVTDGTTVLEETYNRYYASGASTGYAGGLKYHLGALATARLKQAYSGTALSALTDAQVADYADNYFEYDTSNKRVTKAVTAGEGCSACSGGQGTSTFVTTENASPGSGVNDWVAKVAETLEDGTVRIAYANKYGQTLLAITTEAGTSGRSWLSYTKYDSVGRVILAAAPSAVSGYDETLSDLVGYSGSTATHLRDSEGLIATYAYGTSTTATTTTAANVTGYMKSTAIQRGETGTSIPQSEQLYIARTASSVTTYHVASGTQYRNTNGTGGQTSSVAYTWQGSTHAVASITGTLPTVTSGQNGPGTAATGTSVYDHLGRPIWSKDAAGVLSYTAYDAGTGAVVKVIQDVNTANTSDFANLPSGWSASGLHLIGTFEVDTLGRTTKSVDPLGNIDYTVYLDTNHEVRIYSGWNTGTNTPTGPITVYRDNRALGYIETITMSATPSVSGNRPTGAEAISGIQSLSRSYRNAAGQYTHTDDYHNLTGVTYSTAANIGTLNTNYYRTQSGFDKKGLANKTVSAAGTITRTENDALGRAVSTWVGTDDTPTTGFWSTTNLAGTNMVKVAEVEYDGGGVGDSNATKMTMVPGGGAANRVSQSFYDWRNRAVASKSGVETSESTSVNRPITYTEYDNLGGAIVSEVYDGDAVAIVDAGGDGVPDRPTSSLLRAKTVYSYDELGRAYKTETYSVDPSTGSVSTDALTSQVWFDLRGLTLKSSSPGGLVQKTAYDALGRATTMYVSDGSGDSAWGDADDVTGDTVLSQSEVTYDAAGNAVLSVSRERFHDASGTGALGTPSSGVAARVSYSAAYYDKLNRLTDAVDVGTNGGSSWTRPNTVSSRSDMVLVSSTEYDSAGRAWKVIDPRGLESRNYYDLLGRTTKTIENYVDGTVSDTDDKTTEYSYSAAGMTKLRAGLTGGGYQETEWVYGVGSSGNLYSNDIVGATKWPDPTTGASSSGQQETVTVNALGQVLTSTDRNGNVHTVGYDVLGRVVSDAVTTLGSGVDGAVRRIEMAYDSQGNAYLVTSYSAASGGSVANQVQRAFNGLGQLTQEWQSHSGAVNTSTTPSVQYAYSTLDSNNRSRLTSMTYPSGYVLTYNYSSGLNSSISRLSSLSDAGGTLESYDFLGLDTVVRRAHPGSGVDLTYIGAGTADAGDKYVGLDRFGRVVDQKWVNSSTSAVTDQSTYTYDRDSNRLTKGNVVNSAFNEVYTYDGLNQLASFNQGSGTHTQSFDYDALGNRDSVTTNSTMQSYTTNKQNEITGISGATTPTYDANGNMTTDETGKQFAYDAWNRLMVVKSSSGTALKTYGYDGLYRRLLETVSSTTTDLYHSSNSQVLEERVGGATTTVYVWSPVYVNAMILRDRDTNANGTLDERLWVQQDANWNVTALVNNGGTVAERYVYDPFGEVTFANTNWIVLSGSAYGWQHLFQGGKVDSTSGMINFQLREYSVSQGRWATNDHIQYKAGDVDLYRFLANRVTISVDPTGLEWSWGGAIGGAGAGALVGGVVGAVAGAPFFGIGALPGAVAGAVAGGVIGFVAGGLGTKPAFSIISGSDNPQTSFEEDLVMGVFIGVPSGIVGGILGPAALSFATGAFWVSPTAVQLGIATPGGTVAVCRWPNIAPTSGSWVMVGPKDRLAHFLSFKGTSWSSFGTNQAAPYQSGGTFYVNPANIGLPGGWEFWKVIFGQRVMK